MKKRYFWLEVWRIIFTFLIASYHFRLEIIDKGRGGYIAVEFFYIVSGFLLMHTFEKKTNWTAWEYTKSRIARLYPHYIFTFILLFIVRNIYWESSFKDVIERFVKAVPEIFMMAGSTFSLENSARLNGPTWYLTPLLLVGYVAWYFLHRHKNVFEKVIVVLCPLFIYGYLYQWVGYNSDWRTPIFGLLNNGMLRGMAGICLGIVCYRLMCIIVDYLQKIGVTRLSRPAYVFWILVGCIGFAATLIASFKWYAQRIDFLYLFVIAVCTLILTTVENLKPENTPTCENGARKGMARYVEAFSSLSYPIYLNHRLIIIILTSSVFLNGYSVYLEILYFVIVMAFSALTSYIVNHITVIAKKRYQKFLKAK